mgnify:CR=1 FL=1
MEALAPRWSASGGSNRERSPNAPISLPFAGEASETFLRGILHYGWLQSAGRNPTSVLSLLGAERRSAPGGDRAGAQVWEA